MPSLGTRFAQLAASAGLALLAGSAPAAAQEGLGWILAGATEPSPRLELGFDLLDGESTTTRGVTSSEAWLSLAYPFSRENGPTWTFTTRLRHLEIGKEDGVLENGDPLPDELWNVSLELGYRKALDKGRVVGGQASVGSASDEPFSESSDTNLGLTAYWMLPRPSGSSWMLFANYSNNRTFLNHVPLPGFAYVYRRSDRFTAVLGLPFVGLFGKPTQSIRYELTVLPPSQVRARGTWVASERVELSTTFRWWQSPYLRPDRDDSDDRLFRDEKRAAAELAFRATDTVRWTLAGGWAFDRSFFEGEDYDDRHDAPVELPDGPFVSLRLEASF